MKQEEIVKNKLLFKTICHQYIQREGIDDLLQYLDGTDFYTAPSSSKFHLNEAGGLCLHSMNVFHTALTIIDTIYNDNLKKGFINIFQKDINLESVAIVTLFHDLCKVGLYVTKEKWKKVNNQWQSYSGFEIEDNFPIGHGEKSCLLLHSYMKLTKEEMLAIRWHMGMFDIGEASSSSRISFYNALKTSPLVSIMHSADFLASNLLEKTTEI